MATGRSQGQRQHEGARGRRRLSDRIKTQRRFASKALYRPTHRFDPLDRRLCPEEWRRTALDAVLANKGARTAGIDGVTKRAFTSEEARVVCTRELRTELRPGRFCPRPVRRVHIPQANGRMRPLGMATLQDRVVQRLVKMVLEPLWESDFLNCANGFRPRRRTMAGLALLDSSINPRTKDYWVIEGAIKGAFDHAS